LHDRNRPYIRSSHESTVYWIKRINEVYKKNKIDHTILNALITVTKETLKYPKEVVDEYAKLGLKTIHLRFLSKLGYAGKNKAMIEYPAEEFIDFWKKAVDYIIELNKKGIFFRERTIMIMLQKIMTGKDPNYLDMRSPCGAIIGQMAYNYNGDIYSCDEGRMLNEETFRIGSVKKDRYASVVCSHESCSIIAASINDSQICDDCAYKPYCGLCPVCSYAEQGTTIGIISKTTFCKVYMAQFDYIFEKYVSDKDAKSVFDLWLNPNDKDKEEQKDKKDNKNQK
jgi:radical SAM protein with 4Fe4S-binding SPASM domain